MIQLVRAFSMLLSGAAPVWEYFKMHVAVKAGVTTGAFPWFFGRGISGIEDAAIFAGGVVLLFWLMTSGKVLADRY